MVKNHTGRRPGQKHARVVHKMRLRRQMRKSSGSEVDVEMKPVDVLSLIPEVPQTPLTAKPASIPTPVQNEVTKVTVVPKNTAKIVVEAPKEPVKVTKVTVEDKKDDPDRPQRSDEDTDQYLRDLYTPSIESLSAACSQNNIYPKRCGNCHCLLLDTESMSKLRSLFHTDSDATLNCVSSISDTSLGLRTLFNEAKALLDLDSLSSFGLRSLFDEKSSKSDTNASSYGLRTLFDEKSLKTDPTASSYGLRTLFDEKSSKTDPTASSYGLRTLFSEGKSSSETMSLHGLFSDSSKSETAVSSLLHGLFDSNTNVKGLDISDKERKKALIAKDLAQYLNSDDERSAPKSQSLSTFVAQIESLFERYRIALNVIDKLEGDVEQLKKDRK